LTANAGSDATYFVGNHYEVTGSEITKYYYAGSQRVAMRKNGTLNFILGDHLGSTSLVTDSSGAVINETKYKAWGETRYSSGNEVTEYQYTGQYSYESDFGLYFYNARFYDPSLGRFAQADTIVPSGVQGLDRYAYTLNNPINYTDPSGHVPTDCFGTNYCGASNSNLLSNGRRGVSGLGRAGGGLNISSGNVAVPTNIPSPSSNLPQTSTPTPTLTNTTSPESSISSVITTPTPTICPTPPPGSTSCTSHATPPAGWTPPEDQISPFVDELVEYAEPLDFFDPYPNGMDTSFSDVVDDIFMSLPKYGIPAIYDVGRWYSGEKIFEIGAQWIMRGGPIIILPAKIPLDIYPTYPG
jgi:RHS repeat-associated protein